MMGLEGKLLEDVDFSKNRYFEYTILYFTEGLVHRLAIPAAHGVEFEYDENNIHKFTRFKKCAKLSDTNLSGKFVRADNATLNISKYDTISENENNRILYQSDCGTPFEAIAPEKLSQILNDDYYKIEGVIQIMTSDRRSYIIRYDVPDYDKIIKAYPVFDSHSPFMNEGVSKDDSDDVMFRYRFIQPS